MSKSATPESLSFADADARLDGALSAGLDGDYDEVLFFDGDLALDGDFLEAVDALLGGDGGDVDRLVVVTGDLTVKGRIALYEDYPGLHVGGRTEAETLEGGDAEIDIHDGAFTHLVYGYYNHGTLRTGTVDTPWVIEYEHIMEVHAPDARWVDNLGDVARADYVRKDIADAFVPEVVDKDGGLLIENFLDRLRSALPVLLPGARTSAERKRERIAGAVADRVEHLDLTGRKLREFPAEVLQIPWLRTLILDGNLIGELPAELGTLTSLEHLSLRYCGLTSLPESIGDLAALRVLRLAGNRTGERNEVTLTVPATIGRLAALEELDISWLSVEQDEDLTEVAPFLLPETFGGLVALRRLVADETNVVFPESAHGLAGIEEVSLAGSRYLYLTSFPEAVTTFPNLRRLDLSNRYFDTVPESLLRLTRLEELDLGGSLARVDVPLPDLGRLPALRVLDISGYSSHSTVPVPPHTVLRELLGMALTALEELRVGGWGKQDDRGELEPEYLAGIGAFRRLRTLNLAANRLRYLPAEFYTLPELATVGLRNNKLHKAVRDRITAAYPTARIDFGT
ncbi:leucine-rich repeat domain-containing protein [Longispora urticae]